MGSPDAFARIDSPNRQSFDGAAPRKLTYAETDRLISAFAARLRGLGLRNDAIVALQLANTVDGVIALLGVLRAGMIAAPLPLLWRQQEIVAALRGVGAKAIVTAGAVSARNAMLAAVELFPIRHICVFGRDLPDGVVPFDDIFAGDAPANAVGSPPPGPAAAHVAVVTFDVTPGGRERPGAQSSAAYSRRHRRFLGASRRSRRSGARRSSLPSSAAWLNDAALVDVASFGEIGLFARCRGADGLPAPISHGRVSPRGADDAVTVAETARTRAGTLALRGPITPQPFLPGPEAGTAPDGFLDTCRLEGDGLIVTGAPGGIFAVGGYRFSQQALEAELAGIDAASTMIAVPHGMLGQRLAGAATDPSAARAVLRERGVNPLIADAFRAPQQDNVA